METNFYKELKKSLLSYKKQRYYKRQLIVFWAVVILTLTFWTWFVSINDINIKVIVVGFIEISFLFFLMYKFLLTYMLLFGNAEVTDKEIKKEIEIMLKIKENKLKTTKENQLKNEEVDTLILEKEIFILKVSLV